MPYHCFQRNAASNRTQSNQAIPFPILSHLCRFSAPFGASVPLLPRTSLFYAISPVLISNQSPFTSGLLTSDNSVPNHLAAYPCPCCSSSAHIFSVHCRFASSPLFSFPYRVVCYHCHVIALGIASGLIPLPVTAIQLHAVSRDFASSLSRLFARQRCPLPSHRYPAALFALSHRFKQICAGAVHLCAVHRPIIGHRCCSSPFHVYSCPFPLRAFLFIPSPWRCESSLIGPLPLRCVASYFISLPWQRNTFRFFSLPPQGTSFHPLALAPQDFSCLLLAFSNRSSSFLLFATSVAGHSPPLQFSLLAAFRA